MIYIRRASKKTKRKIIEKYSVTDAKLMLYDLSKLRLDLGHYYVAGADRKEEMEDILDFFSTDYLKPNNDGEFTVYEVQENIPKPKRITKKITPTSFMAIKRKIESEIPYFETTVKIENKSYQIVLSNLSHIYTFHFNDELEIQDSSVQTSVNTNYVKDYEKIKKKIKSLLVKQKSYYKSKSHGN